MAKTQQPSAKCPNCGAIPIDSARFCVECGTPLVSNPETSPGTIRGAIPETSPGTIRGAMPETSPGTIRGTMPETSPGTIRGTMPVVRQRVQTNVGMPAASPTREATSRKTLDLDVATTVGAGGLREPATSMAEALNDIAASAAAAQQPMATGRVATIVSGADAEWPASSEWTIPDAPPAQAAPAPAQAPTKASAAQPAGSTTAQMPAKAATTTKALQPTKKTQAATKTVPVVAKAETPAVKPRSKPPAKPARPTPAPISDILNDIDTTFDTILRDPRSVSQGPSPEDLAQAEILFKQITAAYIGPVRDFMIELEMGEPTKEWIQVCAPALGSLQSAADRMSMAPLVSALGELRTALERAESWPGDTIAADARERVLGSSRSLVALLPEAFAVEQERDRREPIIVRSLLCQVPNVRKVQLDRIYRAGLNSLKMFYMASAWDLAQTTGLSVELSEAIVQRFERYKKESAAAGAGGRRAVDLAHLDNVVRQLSSLNDAYEGRTRGATIDKKHARQERNQAMLEINVLLARLGAVDLVATLERMPFDRKAAELEQFLDRQRELYNSAGAGEPLLAERARR